MEINLDTVITIAIGVIVAIGGAFFKYVTANMEKDIKDLKTKDNQLEARQYEIENNVFAELKITLEGVKKDIEFIKTEISNLKQK